MYVIADIINKEGCVCKMDELGRIYGLYIYFFNCITESKSVKKFIGDYKTDNNFQFIQPYVRFHMKALLA